MVTLRQSTDPAKWLPITDGELRSIEALVNEGRLSDITSIRRFVVLRLIAEVRRRKPPLLARIRDFFWNPAR